MNRQVRINRPQRQRPRRNEVVTPLVQPQLDDEQPNLDIADSIVMEIVAERIGDRTQHERAGVIDDERIYNENQQRGGQ